ncbi:MAG: succinylglutamate desuccinylase/aspartoacylase family protein [Verrucomicrobiales bacterium]|nr:succinylglutamate desuccinylase/aspartoacylase family protein [Verrucomicrobiales bacterium]
MPSDSLHLRQFASDLPGPHLLITGGVHGDEFEPMAAIRRLIAHFDASDALRCGRLTLVPCVNEAAFLRGHRCAGDGLDLARTCPGRPDGSETERTAHRLSELIRQATHYIDLHTGGTEFAVHPLAGYVLHPDPSILDTQRAMARAFNLPVIWGTSPALEGRSLSVARDAGVPAIYCEYLGSATVSEAGIGAYVDGCLNVMALLGLVEPRDTAGRVGRVIEDATPGSGHMQVQNPSPIDGYFTPAIALGDVVETGQPLGTVTDLTGADTRTLSAAHPGIVLTLRTFPRVRAGEMVAVVAHL